MVKDFRLVNGYATVRAHSSAQRVRGQADSGFPVFSSGPVLPVRPVVVAHAGQVALADRAPGRISGLLRFTSFVAFTAATSTIAAAPLRDDLLGHLDPAAKKKLKRN